jgi:hypothetical protein
MKVIKDVSQDGCEITFTYTDDTEEIVNINDCPPIPLNFRINSEGGWDYSYEGYSWESMAPLPGFPDPADGRAYGPDFPAQSVLDPACNSAFAITDLLIDQQVDTYNGLVAGNDAEELAVGALASAASILTGIGAAFAFIFGGTIGAIVDYVNDNDEATWNALFTSAFWDEVRCMLYCNADSEGNFGIDEYNMLMLDLETETGQEWQDVKGWIETLGPRGLSGAWTLRPDIVYDCSACACPYDWSREWLFDDSMGGWTVEKGAFVPGTGVVAGDAGEPTDNKKAQIGWYGLDPTVIKRVELLHDKTFGTFTANARTEMVLSSPDFLINTVYPNGQQGNNINIVWNGSNTTDGLQIYIRTSWGNISGSGVLKRLRIFGEGTDPFS